MNKFITFLESLKTNNNKLLIDHIQKGFIVCHENINDSTYGSIYENIDDTEKFNYNTSPKSRTKPVTEFDYEIETNYDGTVTVIPDLTQYPELINTFNTINNTLNVENLMLDIKYNIDINYLIENDEDYEGVSTPYIEINDVDIVYKVFAYNYETPDIKIDVTKNPDLKELINDILNQLSEEYEYFNREKLVDILNISTSQDDAHPEY